MTLASMPLFYTRPQVLQPALHARVSLAPAPGYGFAAQANAVPLVVGEFTSACRHFPVVFTPGTDPHPVAVLGLRSGENLFVDGQGRWRAGSYVPAYVRRYPFIFLENEARSEFTLCIDAAAAALVDGPANPLFDTGGQPTAVTRQALAFCRDYEAQQEPTQAFVRALVAAGLLVERQADVELNDGRRMSLAGFQVIDADRFNALPDADFLRWRARGWLAPVHAHFVSVGAWSALLH